MRPEVRAIVAASDAAPGLCASELACTCACSSTDLHAPALCDVEVTAALRRALLRGLVTAGRADAALSDYRDLPLTRHAHVGLLSRVLRLRHNFSAYDACYIALAEGLEADLLTGDRALGRAVREHLRIRVESP